MTDEAGRGRDGKRLFVGIRPSMTTVAQLGEVTESLARRATNAGVPIRWLPPASYHVTLKFLGWGKAEVVPAVVDALRAAAAVAPFTFSTARLGAFPSRDKATVVWAGCDSDALGRLARAADAALAPLGFAPDRRPFHGHVTLGRLRDPRGVSEVILPFAEQMFSETRVHSITLYESLTKSTGSEHLEIATIDLDPTRNAGFSAPGRQTRPVERGLESIDTDDGWPRGQGPSSDE
jgi:2'-5' RNA ligase